MSSMSREEGFFLDYFLSDKYRISHLKSCNKRRKRIQTIVCHFKKPQFINFDSFDIFLTPWRVDKHTLMII